MYEAFGAAVADHAVEFRLFFPDARRDPSQYSQGGLPRIRRIRVVGDFQGRLGSADWDREHAPAMTLAEHPHGMLYALRLDGLPDGFYQYKYFVEFENGTTRWCGDPCTKYVASRHENAAFVIGGHDAAVEPIAARLPLSDLVIYELMVDDFTAGYRGDAAPVDAVKDKIDHLVDLGVNAVEFMPWTAWRGGGFSWGYDPFLFFAVEDRLIGDPRDPLDRLYRLKTLVTELHRRRIHVIMDGVFNHVNAGLDPDTGFPYHWLYQDPSESPFTGGFAHGGYFEDLDYNNRCTAQFVFDVAKFWLDEYQLDGIRFDYTLGFYLEGETTRGLPDLVAEIKAHLATTHRDNVALILEHLTDNRYEAINATNAIGASGCWYDPFFWNLPRYAAGGYVDPHLMRVLDANRDFAPGKAPVVYVENHDHSTLTHRLGGRERWWKAQPPLLALFTAPGAVLLHNGQEFGDDHFLPEEGAGRVQARPLRWASLGDPAGQRLLALHRRLIRLRAAHPALRSPNFHPRVYDERRTRFDDQGYGVDVAKGVAIYHRWGLADDGQVERFIVVLNFSEVDQSVDVPFSVNGRWEDLLDDGAVEVDGFRLAGQQVGSNWGKVFYRKG